MNILITNNQLKKFCTGKGNASKEEMMKAVAERWGVKSNNDNICDAVALAQWGLNASTNSDK